MQKGGDSAAGRDNGQTNWKEVLFRQEDINDSEIGDNEVMR
jgi:hypothetical protein